MLWHKDTSTWPRCPLCGTVMRPASLSPCLFDGKVSRRRKNDSFVYCRLFDDIICSAVNCYVTALTEGFSEADVQEGCPSAAWVEGPGSLCPAPAVVNPAPIAGYACGRCGLTDRLLEKRGQWSKSREPHSE